MQVDQFWRWVAYGKTRAGAALGNPVLATEGRVTLIDGILAAAVLAGLALKHRLRLVVGRPTGRPGDDLVGTRGGSRGNGGGAYGSSRRLTCSTVEPFMTPAR